MFTRPKHPRSQTPSGPTQANAGKHFGFAGKSRVVLSLPPGVAEFVRAYHEKVRNHRSVAHGSTAASRTFLATQVALPLERPGCGGYCCCNWLGIKRGLGFCFPRRHYQRSVASQRGHTFNRHALRLGMPYSLGVYHLARLALQDSARSTSPTMRSSEPGHRVQVAIERPRGPDR